VHGHNSGPLFTGTLAAKLARAKGVIITDHSRPFPERFSVVAAEFVLSRLVDEIVSVSDQNKKDLLQHLHWPARKISVIHNGVDEAPPATDDQLAALRTEFDLSPSRPVVFVAARLEPQKNIALLIEAARVLRTHGLDADYLVAGGGSEQARLEKLVVETGMRDRFHLAGWRLDTAQLLRAADIFALPSDWEGLPMSILEAMSASRPVVATDVGDVHRAVVNEQTGLLVPPRDVRQLADALARLLADPALRERLGAAGHALWREKFSVEKMVARYEELYARYA
jgi:glycosyltransferase involved in cell wall biosynthesis